MPYKDPEKQKQAQHDWYLRTNRRAQMVKYNKEQRAKRLAVVNALKLKGGCNRCGYNRCTAALEFHHRDPSLKNFTIADGVMACRNIDEILAECQLCEIVCSNCHREAHAKPDDAG